MMRQLHCIGEALIDLIAHTKGQALDQVTTFERVAGGAPANVAAVVASLGGRSSLITKLGNDAFGDYLVATLNAKGVGVEHIFRTSEANTALAFVSVKEDGDRDFSFYRNPSADLLMSAEELEKEWFNRHDILHFGSVDLVESPMKHAHRQAIEWVIQAGGIVSFDPNVRTSLWHDLDVYKQTINEFLPYAHILKVSEDELEFITGMSDETQAIASLFQGNVKMVLYTKGANGASIYTKNHVYEAPAFSIKVADTTGAGDAFMGGMLYQLLINEATVSTLDQFVAQNGAEALRFANATGALVASVKGAIDVLPTERHVHTLIDTQLNPSKSSR